MLSFLKSNNTEMKFFRQCAQHNYIQVNVWEGPDICSAGGDICFCFKNKLVIVPQQVIYVFKDFFFGAILVISK